MHPSNYLSALSLLLLANLHDANGVDLNTVSITSLAQFEVEPACVQSCMYYNSFGVADYLLFALGCTSTVYNECYCTQIQDQRASTVLSTCINTMCSGTPEIAPALSLYESYCSVAGYPRNAVATQTSSSPASSSVSPSSTPTASSPSPTTTPAVTSPPSVSTPSSSTSSSSPASNSSTTSTITSGKKKSNTGAIVGGVVGGLAALALIISLIFFYLRSRRQKSPQSQHQEAAAVKSSDPPPPSQPEKEIIRPVSPVSPVSAKAVPVTLPKNSAGGRAELGVKEDEPTVHEVQGEGRYGLRPEELDAEGRYIGELHGDGRQITSSELP